MIRHVVVWKFKEENKEHNIRIVREKLEELPEIIFDIDKFEVGRAVRGDYDLALSACSRTWRRWSGISSTPPIRRSRIYWDRVVERRALVDYVMD